MKLAEFDMEMYRLLQHCTKVARGLVEITVSNNVYRHVNGGDTMLTTLRIDIGGHTAVYVVDIFRGVDTVLAEHAKISHGLLDVRNVFNETNSASDVKELLELLHRYVSGVISAFNSTGHHIPLPLPLADTCTQRGKYDQS